MTAYEGCEARGKRLESKRPKDQETAELSETGRRGDQRTNGAGMRLEVIEKTLTEIILIF